MCCVVLGQKFSRRWVCSSHGEGRVIEEEQQAEEVKAHRWSQLELRRIQGHGGPGEGNDTDTHTHTLP